MELLRLVLAPSASEPVESSAATGSLTADRVSAPGGGTRWWRRHVENDGVGIITIRDTRRLISQIGNLLPLLLEPLPLPCRCRLEQRKASRN